MIVIIGNEELHMMDDEDVGNPECGGCVLIAKCMLIYSQKRK